MDVSMKQKHDHKQLPQPTSEESLRKQRIEKLNEQLREHPELLAQFESILAIATETGPDGHFRTADEVEALTIEALRKLGQQTMEQWAQAAQERAVEDCRKEHPTARIKKKAR
jgi:hypothetical protein